MVESRRVNIRLRAGRDNDILAWLRAGGDGNAAAMIRSALRYYIAQQAINMDAVTMPPPLHVRKNKKVETTVHTKKNKEKTGIKNNLGDLDLSDPGVKVDNFLNSLGVNNNDK